MKSLHETVELFTTSAKKKDITLVLRGAQRLADIVGSLNRGQTMYRQHAVVLLVSRFENFISDSLRAIYASSPTRLRAGGKSLPYEELLDAKSIDEVINRLIEKEIDRILREAPDSIISTLDDQFKLGIRENFRDYNRFLDICDQRNLFVHTGGVTSRRRGR